MSQAPDHHESARAFERPNVPIIDQTVGFDVRGHARTARGLRHDDLDPAAFAEQPLSDVAAGLVTVLADVFSGTIAELRDVLVTPAHRESRMTAFLTTRAFELYWTERSLRAIVPTPPVVTDAGGPSARSLAWRPARLALTSNLLGHDHAARTATTGLLDSLVSELVAAQLAGSDERLAEGGQWLREMLQNHVTFYREQAHLRLRRSRRAQRLTRRALQEWRWPRRGVRAPADLLAGAAQQVRAVADEVATLPGLGRLRLHVDRQGIRADVRRVRVRGPVCPCCV